MTTYKANRATENIGKNTNKKYIGNAQHIQCRFSKGKKSPSVFLAIPRFRSVLVLTATAAALSVLQQVGYS